MQRVTKLDNQQLSSKASTASAAVLSSRPKKPVSGKAEVTAGFAVSVHQTRRLPLVKKRLFFRNYFPDV